MLGIRKKIVKVFTQVCVKPAVTGFRKIVGKNIELTDQQEDDIIKEKKIGSIDARNWW